MNCKTKLLKKHENKLPNKIKHKNMGLLPALMGAGINAGMGLLLEGHNDRRQLEQQRKLQALEIQGQKQMGDYNYGKQLQFWKDTNYKAQMQQLAEAGLNPALMYKQGGAGGMTIGAPAGKVTGGQAPGGGMEILNMMANQAQIELIKAQTEKTKVETTKTAGVDTKLGETQIQSLTQGISNAKSQQALTEVQTSIAGIDEHIKGQTQNHVVAQIQYATQILSNDRTISEETKDAKINQMHSEAINAILQNLKTQADTDQVRKAIEKLDNDMKIAGETLDLQRAQLALNTAIADGTIINWSGNALDVIKRLVSSWMSKGKGGH